MKRRITAILTLVMAATVLLPTFASADLNTYYFGRKEVSGNLDAGSAKISIPNVTITYPKRDMFVKTTWVSINGSKEDFIEVGYTKGRFKNGAGTYDGLYTASYDKKNGYREYPIYGYNETIGTYHTFDIIYQGDYYGKWDVKIDNKWVRSYWGKDGSGTHDVGFESTAPSKNFKLNATTDARYFQYRKNQKWYRWDISAYQVEGKTAGYTKTPRTLKMDMTWLPGYAQKEDALKWTPIK